MECVSACSVCAPDINDSSNEVSCWKRFAIILITDQMHKFKLLDKTSEKVPQMYIEGETRAISWYQSCVWNSCQVSDILYWCLKPHWKWWSSLERTFNLIMHVTQLEVSLHVLLVLLWVSSGCSGLSSYIVFILYIVLKLNILYLM